MQIEQILCRMVQVGIVSTTDSAKRRVRVDFQATGIHSGWLQVLRTAEMPRIGNAVLVLYLPEFNADGYVLGVI